MYNETLPIDMADCSSVIRQVQAVCREELAIEISSPDEDLFAAGLLDSMTLVQFIFRLEQSFNLVLPMQELELDSFRSLARIAQLLQSKRALEAARTAA